MRHIRSLAGISLGKTWLTIGVFDGVHRGHQQILKALTEGAHAQGAQAVVLSFYPHPAAVLGKREIKYLTPPDEKAALLETHCHADVLITHPFDRAVAVLSPEAFIAKLKKHLDLQKLLVGYDFALGKNRIGDAAYLKEMGKKDGYVVQQFAPLYADDGKIISSTLVRATLADGNLVAVTKLLGQPYALTGKVIPGDGRGRTIGVPTANIAVPPEKALPPKGVYACYAVLNGKKHPAVTNLGVHPTFTPDKVDANIEAHLLDFDGDLYGKELKLEFIDRLRLEKKFDGVEALLKQIYADIAKAREILV